MRAFLSLGVMTFALSPALCAGQAVDDAQEWLLEELRNLQQIRSIEFVATREQDFGSFPLPQGAPVDRTVLEQSRSQMQMKFFATGMCLRVEVDDQNTIAFDGTTLRTLRDNGRAFGETKSLPDAPLVAFPHPIMWAYRWARRLNSYGDIPTLQDDANWDPLLESARVLENRMIEVSRLDANGGGYVYEIERGPDGRLFSWAGYKLPGRKLEGRITVVDALELTDEDTQKIWLPTAVRFETGGEGYVRIDPATLKVNHDIDPDVFTISRFEAKELLPVSDPTFTPDSDLAAVRSNKQSWQLIVLINVVLVVFGLIYWRLRRRSQPP